MTVRPYLFHDRRLSSCELALRRRYLNRWAIVYTSKGPCKHNKFKKYKNTLEVGGWDKCLIGN